MTCIPHCASTHGSRPVLTAARSRLMAVAKPTPSERMSVGKLSAGKMPTRLLTAEMVVLKRTESSSVNELPEGKQAMTTSVAASSKKLPSKNSDVPAGASELIQQRAHN